MVGCRVVTTPAGALGPDQSSLGRGLVLWLTCPCRAPLQELCRVLKPGATVAILDFNNVQNPAVDAFQVGWGAVASWWWWW